MKLPDFLTQTPAGEVVLTGHRVGLFHLVHYYNEGYSPEMLVCQYPTLSLPLVHKVIAFYLENVSDVDAYVGNCRTELDQEAAQAKRLDLSKLRQRLESSGQPMAPTPA